MPCSQIHASVPALALVELYLKTLGSFLRPLEDPELCKQLGPERISKRVDSGSVFAVRFECRPRNIIRLLVHQVISSIGVSLKSAHRKLFDTALKKLLSNSYPQQTAFKLVTPSFPDRLTCFDFCYSEEEEQWIQWEVRCPSLNRLTICPVCRVAGFESVTSAAII